MLKVTGNIQSYPQLAQFLIMYTYVHENNFTVKYMNTFIMCPIKHKIYYNFRVNLPSVLKTS